MNPVICYLTRNDDKTVKQLLASLRLLYKNFRGTFFGIPVVVFHEHGFTHQKLIQSKYPVRFVEVELKPSVRPVPEFMDKLNYPIGYRNMCQFFHSEFYKYLDGYDWFMRLDTDSFIIDKMDNPFEYLEKNNKVYGYLTECPEWAPSVKYLDGWFEILSKSLNLQTPFYKSLIVDGKYGLRQIYNNCEIISRKYFENPLVEYIMDEINKSGNIYRWRWGDAPLRTLTLSMCYEKKDIHRFREVGYHHGWIHQKNGVVRSHIGGAEKVLFDKWNKDNDWIL